jgi:diaminohydroxyphosphoribosylaminopyrimidine deaminase/5-amino-6-(5-phosphoribosylamino)uracil reductase
VLQPVRVVLDSRQRLPLDSKLVREAHRLPTVDSHGDPNNRLTDAGVTVIQVAQNEGRPDPKAVLAALNADFDRRLVERFGKAAAGTMGLNLMIEGGGQVAASFLQRRPGRPASNGSGRRSCSATRGGRPSARFALLKDLSDAPRFRRLAVETVRRRPVGTLREVS